MAYEFLKKLFGTPKDGEEPKAMTYAELEAAIDADKKIQVVWFYACGKRWREKRAGAVEGATEVQRIYSFEHDDDYIYSAFLTQYHIDLQDIEYLHWWKFKALLRTLSSDLELQCWSL